MPGTPQRYSITLLRKSRHLITVSDPRFSLGPSFLNSMVCRFLSRITINSKARCASNTSLLVQGM